MKRFVFSLLVLATVTVLAMHSVEIWSQEDQATKAKEQAEKNVEDKEPTTHDEARRLAANTPGFKNLQRIGLAFHGYHDIFRQFPPAVLIGPDGKTPYSWRVELLPVLRHYVDGIDPNKLNDKTGREQYNDLIAACGYDITQPWDSPKNRQVLEAMPEVFRHPSDQTNSFTAAYYAVVGTGTAFDPNDTARDDKPVEADVESNRRTEPSGFKGWPARTLMIVESRSREPWTRPIDIAYSESATVPRFGGFTKNGFLALSCDGSVHFVSDAVSPKDLRGFISKDTKDEFTILGIPYQYK